MKRVAAFDGLRGIAILLVLGGHTVLHLRGLAPETRQWLYLFARPDAGVRLFFVLSGYLITHLLLAEHEATGTISLRRFYGRRALRIFPAFYLYLMTITVLERWTPSGITPQTWTAAATFTWNYASFWVTPPPEGTWNLGHLWTLALEQQFYLLWPAVIALAGPRRALGVAVFLIAWCPLARLATYGLLPGQRGQLNIMAHTGADSLMFGCAAALLVRSTARREQLRRVRVPLALVAALWLAVVSPLLARTLRGFPLVAGFTLDALAAAWLCVWAHHRPAPMMTAFLGRGPLPALGLISYSLYLWQQLFLRPEGAFMGAGVALSLLAALAAGLASYLLVERPMLRFRLRLRPTVSTPSLAGREPA